MEEKKEKKTIKCSYAVLVIILFAALAFVTDYAFIERKISKCDCPKCEAANNEVINGDIENKDNTDNTQVTEDQTYSYEDIGSTRLSIDFNEQNYVAEIVDGNIVLTLSSDSTNLYYKDKSTPFSGTDTIILKTGNAKSLYYITYHQGGVYRLFFITDDNRLYEISEDLLTIFAEKYLNEYYPSNIMPKILSDNATQFVEYGRYNTEKNAAYELYPEYISVLDANGSVNKVFFDQIYKFGPYEYEFVQ